MSSEQARPHPRKVSGYWMPKSTLTVLNDKYREITGFSFFIRRRWDLTKQQSTYLFSDGTTNVTYVGALLTMRREFERVSAQR